MAAGVLSLSLPLCSVAATVLFGAAALFKLSPANNARRLLTQLSASHRSHFIFLVKVVYPCEYSSDLAVNYLMIQAETIQLLKHQHLLS